MRLFLVLMMVVGFVTSVSAQTRDITQPDPPKSLQDMVDVGAQIFYLGDYEGMKGWVLIRKGQPEYFYENRQGTAIINGLLFSDEGDMITMGQLNALYRRVGDDMYAATGGSGDATQSAPQQSATTPEPIVAPQPFVEQGQPLTRAQQMFVDIIGSNWVTINADGKYDVFAFIDPECPHCKTMIREMKPFLDNDMIKLHAIPIGISDSAQRKASVLLASANPEQRLVAYANGDETQLSAPENINITAAENNKEVLFKWGFNVTPVVIYRTNKGEIRMVRGRPNDYQTIIDDIERN
jgi:hypothetical protein